MLGSKVINIFRVVIFFISLFLLLSNSAAALEYYWGQHSQYDRLVFLFSQPVPEYKIQRTAREAITLTLPEDIWEIEVHPDEVDFSPSTMIAEVKEQENKFRIITTTDSFGFIHFQLAEENKLVVDIFFDPTGAKWQAKDEEGAELAEEDAANKTTELNQTENDVQTEDNAGEPSPADEEDETGETDETDEADEAEVQSNSGARDNASRQVNQAELDSYYRQNDTENTVRSTVNRTVLGDDYQERTKKNASVSGQEKENFSNGYQVRAAIHNVGPEDPYVLKSAQESQNRAGMQDTESGNETVRDKVRQEPEIQQRQQVSPEPLPQKASNETIREPEVSEQVNAQAEEQENATLQKRATADNASSREQAAEQTAAANATQNATQNATKPDFKALITNAKAALANGNIQEAKEVFQGLAGDERLSDELMEKVLHNLADALLQEYKGNFSDHYQELTRAFERAVNHNPESPKVPWALLNLSLINLRVGNIPEARAYFNILKENHPNDPNIPVAYVYWGDYHLKNGNYQKAADNYQQVIQNYPESRVAKEAAVGLLEALKELQFYEQAFEIADYIGKRWPRYYVDVPKILRLTGFVALKQEKYDLARQKYWSYYNLVPDDPDADVVLARLGDIYLLQGREQAAKDMYEEVVSKYPDEQGGLIAKMRLAEEGIYDKPKIEDMFSVFDRPFNLRPVKVYKQISRDYPESPLAPVAQLKLAMWYLFNDQSRDALKAVQEFEERFFQSDLLTRARQVGRQAFEKLALRAFKEEDFARILELWEKFSFLHQRQDQLAPETRLALATSYWQKGDAQKALNMARPFLEEGKTDKYAERALDLLLTIYLEQEKWQKITELENKITKPDWSDKHKAQFKYALALAYENLDETQKSLPLWQEVAEHKNLSSTQRGYAYYFLAQEAMQKENLKDVNSYAEAAVSELWDTGKDQAKILDCLDWLIEANRRTGRLQQALSWAREYEKMITKDHPDWPSFRYRLAELYRDLGDRQMWENVLKGLLEAKPETFYGRMAASDLENQDLMQQADQFLNP